MNPLRRLTFAAFIAFALALTPSLTAQPIWTAVANTGAIDERSLGIFEFNTDAAPGISSLRYLTGSLSTATIIARYNVTNPLDNGLVLPWTTLELGNFDNATNGQVIASLYQVNRCTGATTFVCRVGSTDAAASKCEVCNFAAGSVNFAANLYFVEVIVTRTNVAGLPLPNPAAHTLRIF